MTTKEKILAIVKTLPDDISIDEAIDRLHLLQKVEEGLRQADHGEGIEHDRLMSQLMKDEEPG